MKKTEGGLWQIKIYLGNLCDDSLMITYLSPREKLSYHALTKVLPNLVKLTPFQVD